MRKVNSSAVEASPPGESLPENPAVTMAAAALQRFAATSSPVGTMKASTLSRGQQSDLAAESKHP